MRFQTTLFQRLFFSERYADLFRGHLSWYDAARCPNLARLLLGSPFAIGLERESNCQRFAIPSATRALHQVPGTFPPNAFGVLRCPESSLHKVPHRTISQNEHALKPKAASHQCTSCGILSEFRPAVSTTSYAEFLRRSADHSELKKVDIGRLCSAMRLRFPRTTSTVYPSVDPFRNAIRRSCRPVTGQITSRILPQFTTDSAAKLSVD